MGLSRAAVFLTLLTTTVFSAPIKRQFPASANILYDGRATLGLNAKVFDDLTGPYTFVVKGSKQATDYISFKNAIAPTPLFNAANGVAEQTISVTMDGTSIFTPGAGGPQLGFRRTEVIAQPRNRNLIQSGSNIFHFSVMPDPAKPLNFEHEYQCVFIEPDDGSQIFRLEIGTRFSIPAAGKAEKVARILSHNGQTTLFETPFVDGQWHNFAVQIDFDNPTLGVFFSRDAAPLAAVTASLAANNGVTVGAKGDFHFGLLKLPLADPKDGNGASDVAHKGIQENTNEGLLYSGVFVESANGGVSAGLGTTVAPIAKA